MELLRPEEKAAIEARLEELKAKRPVLSQRIAEARALGDLRENADYHAAREDQGLNEAEIRRLEERLAHARVVNTENMAADVVFLGAMVKLREVDTGDEDVYKLVGEASGSVSLDFVEVTATSPMGESLMKARVGDVIKVTAPKGVIRFEVVEIL